MKVLCDVCEGAVASIMCCADEAALCQACDRKVHAANKLAGKHQRVPMLPSTPAEENGPKCDICQERSAFFFCLEDRALVCRDCDLSIHTANNLAKKHNRYLLTGIRVGLENLGGDSESQDGERAEASAGAVTSESAPRLKKGGLLSGEARVPEYRPEVPELKPEVPEYKPLVPPRSQRTSVGASTSRPQSQAQSDRLHRRLSLSDVLDSAVPVWGVDEILNIPNLAGGYSLNDIGLTKGADALMGDFDWTADMGLFDDTSLSDSFQQVPEVHSPPAVVPSVTPPAPRRSHAALKGKAARYDSGAALVPDADDLFLVPDLGLQMPPPPKRRRQGM